MLRKNKQSTSRQTASHSTERTPAFTYYANRSPKLPSKKLKSAERVVTGKWHLLPSFIALTVIVGSLVYSTMLDTNPRISKGKYRNSVLLQEDTVYQTAAKKFMSENLGSRSKLFLDTKTIEKKLLQQFPELQAASITIPLTGRRPIVSLVPGKEAFLLQKFGENQTPHLIDMQGKSITKRNFPPGSLGDSRRFIVIDDTGLDLAVGKTVLATKHVQFILETAHQLEAKDLQVDAMLLPSIPGELHVRLKGKGYFVKFNMEGDARTQAGTYLSANQRFIRDKITPAEYIDVRVEDKVFYK